jgi:hypothetical protein
MSRNQTLASIDITNATINVKVNLPFPVDIYRKINKEQRKTMFIVNIYRAKHCTMFIFLSSVFFLSYISVYRWSKANDHT